MYYNPRRDTIKTTETSNQRLSGLNVSFIIILKAEKAFSGTFYVSIVHAKHFFISFHFGGENLFVILSICVQIDFSLLACLSATASIGI